MPDSDFNSDPRDGIREGDDDMAQPEIRTVRAGLIPLVDCAPVVAAAEFGFAARQGLDLVLSRESSWAAVRDKLTVGHLDCAHMLGPMVIASTLGVGHVKAPMIAPMALGLNGNAITVSKPLHQRLRAAGWDGSNVISASETLKRLVEADKVAGRDPLTFGVVFPFSPHNYELRGWLDAGGINPDFDVRLVVIPPPLMVDNLRKGLIDGFCVGAPWNTVAVEAGIGEIIVTKSQLWRNGPEKVLGVRSEWAAAHPATLRALIRALVEAAAWVEQPENHPRIAACLAAPSYLGIEARTIERVMAGHVPAGPGDVNADAAVDPDFITFHRHDANFPWRSHAAWFVRQMVRWRQIDPETPICDVAEAVYRPDIYREAVKPLGLDVPEADWKAEGVGKAAGTFFGTASFDPGCGPEKANA